MVPDDFDWSLVRSFLAVVDAGSLSGAARTLGSYQPTLSRQIAELEKQWGIALFERTGRGLAPTQAALRLVPEARAMADAAARLSFSLSAAAPQVQGTVRISASNVMAVHLMPALCVALHGAFPLVDIELVSTNQLSSLHRREADIAIRLTPPGQLTLIARNLGRLAFQAYGSTAYLNQHGRPLKLQQLQQHQLVGLDRDDTLIRAFHGAGIVLTRENFSIRSDDQVALIELVRQGAGIGIFPQFVADRLPEVEPVLTATPLPSLPVWLVVHREISANPAIRSVYDFLAHAISRQLLNASAPLEHSK